MRRKRKYSEFGIWGTGILAEINMTQAELAEIVGCSRTKISELFTGKSTDAMMVACIKNFLLEKVKEHDGKEKAM